MRMFWIIVASCCLCSYQALSQRSYRSGSVLASGTWYKIAIPAPGVYRVDLAFLQSLGINTSRLASSTIRLYGNGGGVLAEPCSATKTDDLAEDAIDMEDGGDGIFDAGDYFLFYAQGPHHWQKDSLSHLFTHIKNIYSESAFYFIQVGGSTAGKRIARPLGNLTANVQASGFDFHLQHELDTINFLGSGKDWYGEEFSTLPGGFASRAFSVSLPHPDSSQDMILNTSCVSRSIGGNSSFAVSVNGAMATNLDIPAVTDGSYDVFGRAVTKKATIRVAQPSPSVILNYNFSPGGYNAQGWLDWWELSGRGLLDLTGLAQLQFRDWNSVGAGHQAEFDLSGALTTTRVWDVSDPATPIEMTGSLTGQVYSFVAGASTLHEYIAFNGAAKTLAWKNPGSPDPYGGGYTEPNGADLGSTSLFVPRALGRVNNQDLHRAPASTPDMLCICEATLSAQATQLAEFHRQHDKLTTQVVTCDQVYNEFAGGQPDPTALRDYVKMYYDRSGGDSSKRPRWLLLFGAGSYDFKDRLNGNTNFVPAYESGVSLDPLNTYTSDDYYALLADADDVGNLSNPGQLDIGVGRIPVRSAAEAAAVVDKIRHYADVRTQGAWRNEMNLVADDGDQNLHFDDAETFAATVAAADSNVVLDKIYLDAYKLQSTPAGGRYPDVNQSILSHLYNGTLLWNYTGHGSNARLSNSDILDQSLINSFNNPDKLPLFITATCDFTPYDNPLVNSIGANLLVRPGTGAIALMTTTRLVFAFSNKVINDNYLRMAMETQPDGTHGSLGKMVRDVKNFTYRTQTDAVNNRKFTLIGDPALTLAWPRFGVQTTTINGKPVAGSGTTSLDTLKALNTCTIGGVVTDSKGTTLSGFNGTLYVTVWDKPRTVTTLGNSPTSLKASFEVQDNILYKGKAPVTKGVFQYSFVVPKDINYKYGHGRINYYAADPSGAGVASAGSVSGADAGGNFTGLLVGGSGTGAVYSGGPTIQAWLNDERFVDGGITGSEPVLLLHLQDSLGINIAGTGIGHDMTAVLDNEMQDPLVLNKFYEADLNTYKKGTVRYPLPVMTEGEHSLVIKVWNVANVSSQVILTFRVISGQKLVLNHVLNYPNPFTTHTTFWFEHNRAGEELSVLVQILTVSGKIVKTIRRTINDAGNRSSEIDWDGRDDYGAKIGRGVYIYLLRVRAGDGSKAEKIEKLYIL